MIKNSLEDNYFSEKNIGDEESFRKLFFENYDRLLSYALRVIKDQSEAEDIIQNVFVTYWEKRESLTDSSPEGLLFIMTRNQCMNYLKKEKVIQNTLKELQDMATFDELYRIDYLNNMPRSLIADDLREKVDLKVSEMPAVCSRVFRMRCFDGFTNKEIANELNCSVKNVEKHLKKARLIMSDYLKGS